MTHTCFICSEEATKRITTTSNQGDFYLCNKSKCKEILEEQLLIINKRMN